MSAYPGATVPHNPYVNMPPPAFQPPSDPTAEKPKKYIKEGGQMKLNPDYIAWRNSKSGAPSTVQKPNEALPVVSNFDEMMEFNEADDGTRRLTDGTSDAIIGLQDPDFVGNIGVAEDEIVDSLGQILSWLEVPIGLIQKLLILETFDSIRYIVDDSGSMRLETDSKDDAGNARSRWEEARDNLKKQVQVLAYLNCPAVTITFLNRSSTIHFEHSPGLTPEEYLADAYRQIDIEFRTPPRGGTPVLQNLQAALEQSEGKREVLQIMCDGVPSSEGMESANEIKAIKRLVERRSSPEDRPVTFVSCTNEDDETEWMKEVEEIAPYCSEYDDFHDERKEIRRDQGRAIPYTEGWHIVNQLVAAINPHDLDRMDESVPFTHHTLQEMMGYEMKQEEYQHYFDGFLRAQRKRRERNSHPTPLERFQNEYDWNVLFEQFLTTDSAANIREVGTYRFQMQQNAQFS